MKLVVLLAALLSGTAAVAMTELPPLATALPPLVTPGTAFAAGEAPGWRFADTSFVDAVSRDPAPDIASLHGFDDDAATALLGCGTIEQMLLLEPRVPGRDEAIRTAALPLPEFDALALGAFDAASGQSLADHSLTLGGITVGRNYTVKFAGQVGADEND